MKESWLEKKALNTIITSDGKTEKKVIKFFLLSTWDDSLQTSTEHVYRYLVQRNYLD